MAETSQVLPTSMLEMPCLGVPFQLGMLYDSRTNQAIPGMTLWDEKLLKTALSESFQPASSAFEIITEDDLSKKSSSLGIEGNLSLSVICGLVSVEGQGAASYFHDRKISSKQARITLKYKCTSKFQQLTMEQLAKSNIQHPDSVFKEDASATHVVTAILYGAEAFFIFDRDITSKENRRHVHGKMQALIKLIPSGNVDLKLNSQDKEETEKFQCKFYGDLFLKHNPSTYEDAVKVYNELPMHFSDHGTNMVPKKIWLHPLSDLDSRAAQVGREISISLITQTQQLIDGVIDIEAKAYDLFCDVIYDCFPDIKDQVLQFLEIIKEHKANFIKNLSELLPLIRGGNLKEQELANLLAKNYQSPMNIKSLDTWIKGKGEELKHLVPFLEVVKKHPGVTMAFEPDELQTALNDIDCENVLSFEFKLSSQCDDDALQQMLSFLRTTGENNQSINPSTQCWYKSNDTIKTIRMKIQRFMSFAKANTKTKVNFLATNSTRDDYEDFGMENIGAVIMHYSFGIANGEFDPPSQPSKLECIDIQDTSVKLRWEPPKFGLDSITHFTVCYRSLDSPPDEWVTRSTKGKEVSMTINQLDAEKKYAFKVRAETDLGHSEDSELCTIVTKPPLVNARLQSVISNSQIISANVPPVTYKIDVRMVSKNRHKHIMKMEFGNPPHPSKPTKVLMVVGATGAGKSTLINAMINFILGVKYENDFRLKLISDEVSQSQAHSQTQFITAYTFYWYRGSPLNFNLTIVDTPGFGDTRGLERDQEITALIREFFQMRGRDGIDELHAIGFVTQASLARLTPTQKYISDSILSIFGKDIKDSIFIMTTFADGADPPVMGAIREARIPHSDFFPFNNSALFVDSTKSKFTQMFWDMGYASLEAFFVKLGKAHSVSLQLTRQVLEERHQLETIVNGIQPQINAGLAKIDELHQEEQMLKANESQILSNEDFTYELTVTKQRQIMTPRGTYVTNCAHCHFTCHDNCIYADDRDKWQCSAMDGKGESLATCRVCPGKCTWRKHFNNGYHFELYEEVEVRTKQELFERYNEAKSAKENIEMIIKKMEDELQQLQNGVLYMIREARGCLQRLDDIALKPNPLTEVEYIDLLITSEEQQKKLGWKKRIEYFYKVRQRAEFLSKIKDQKEFEAIAQQTSKTMWRRFVSTGYGFVKSAMGYNN